MHQSEYTNGYLYIRFIRAGAGGDQRLLYCAGVNITRFRPMTWGTHGQFMNPAFRGLQLLRLKFLIPTVQDLGGSVRRLGKAECGELPGGNGWFRENFEIHNVPEGFAKDTLHACVRYLVEVILKVARPGLVAPKNVSDPAQLEQELDALAASCVSER